MTTTQQQQGKAKLTIHKFVFASDLEPQLDNPAILAEYHDNLGDWVDPIQILDETLSRGDEKIFKRLDKQGVKIYWS